MGRGKSGQRRHLLLHSGTGRKNLTLIAGISLVLVVFSFKGFSRRRRTNPASGGAPRALCLCPLALIGEKVFKAHEKKRTELPSRGLHASEGVSFQETKEELLREVLVLGF